MKLKIKIVNGKPVCYIKRCNLSNVQIVTSENKICCIDCVVESIAAKF